MQKQMNEHKDKAVVWARAHNMGMVWALHMQGRCDAGTTSSIAATPHWSVMSDFGCCSGEAGLLLLLLLSGCSALN